LAVVQVVIKDGVIFDVADKIVKGPWLNVKFVAKAIKTMNSPVIQEMELGGFCYRWCRVENMNGYNFIPQLEVALLPVHIVFHLKIED
jgi:hypothetical protein